MQTASSHNHSAANITSGTLDLARIPSITDAKITSISASKITGTIPQANLPSYVDDVLEYSAKSLFPKTGETGKIYVDTTTNLTYRWGGSSYVEISPSLALGETSSTAFRGDRGKIAYDHSQATGNPHGLTLSNLGISATAAEINKLDGLATTAKELGYVHGVTSSIQTQLNGKANASALAAYLPLSGGTMTGDISARNIELPTGYYIYSVIGEGGGAMVGFVNGHTQLGSIGASTTSATHIRSITGHATIGASTNPTYTILDSGNFTDYTVTKTGSGASGT